MKTPAFSLDARLAPVIAIWGANRNDLELLPKLADTVSLPYSEPLAALKKAAEEYPQRDILLLHGDSVLSESLWLRLRAAWDGRGQIDVLSALDARLLRSLLKIDHSTDADCIAWENGPHSVLEDNYRNLCCSIWRAAAISAVIQDRDTQLCYATLGCAAVDSKREKSNYRSDWLSIDNIHSIAASQIANVFEARQRAIPKYVLDTRPVVLHISHSWGGGVERFVRDQMQYDRLNRHLLLVARKTEQDKCYGQRLTLYSDLDCDPLLEYVLAEPIDSTAVHSHEYASLLTRLIDQWGIGSIRISSWIGHSLDALRTGLPTAVAVHDTYPLWPALTAAEMPDGPISESQIATSIDAAGSAFLFRDSNAGFWLQLAKQLLDDLKNHDVLMVAPSNSAREQFVVLLPDSQALRWRKIGHGQALPVSTPDQTKQTKNSSKAIPERPLRVLIPGRIDGLKGRVLLDQLLKKIPPTIELYLIGSGLAGKPYANRPNLTLLMQYEAAELPELISQISPDLALIPSLANESWSYVASEMLSFSIPVIAAHRGAFIERIKQGVNGWLVETNADAFAELLLGIAAGSIPIPDSIKTLDSDLPNLVEQLERWNDACPSRPPRYRFLTIRRDQQLGMMHPAILAAQSLRQQTRIAELSVALEAAQEKAIAQLDEMFIQYDRDIADMARQRDVALTQRDGLQQQIDRTMIVLRHPYVRYPLAIRRRLKNKLLSLRYRWLHLRTLITRGLASVLSRGLFETIAHIKRRSAALAQRQPALIAQPAVIPPSFVLPDKVIASIIIPVYNKIDYTMACLASLCQSKDNTAFEVIVVDDCSLDTTAQTLPSISGLRYVRNPVNLGFIGACNAGAAKANGEYLVFLNNDTTLQPGWLDKLLSTFSTFPDTGLAGSKLVYPDGRLQEAGGIVFADGSGWNYGRLEDPAHPNFNYVREVDYCSGAAIAVPTSLFRELGGFDSLYAPAYFEDTDLAMRVRQNGQKVRVQPASVVFHHEGVTNGTSLASGIKAYQLRNQQLFLDRWRNTLRQSHPSSGNDIRLASEHRARRYVLVIDACTPTPDRDSGSLRMFELLKLLREEDCAVTFFAENGKHDGRYTEALQQQGVETWYQPWLGSIPQWLETHGARFQIIIVSRHYILSPLLPLLRRFAPQAKVIFDTVDLHFLREQREAERLNDSSLLRRAVKTRQSELSLIHAADLTWVVSPVEKTLLSVESPGTNVQILSNIHQVRGMGPPFEERAGLLFVGGFRHPPNTDAVLWFCQEIWPVVHQQFPQMQFHVVGGDTPESITALSNLAGVRIHGYVEDLETLIDACRISVAPLRYGAGVKGKVNQALAHGLPVIATGCAVEGMDLSNGEDVVLADNVQEFANAIIGLYNDITRLDQLAAAGIRNTQRAFSPERARAALRDLFNSISKR